MFKDLDLLLYGKFQQWFSVVALNEYVNKSSQNKQPKATPKQITKKKLKHFSKLLNYYLNSELQMYFISLVQKKKKKRFTEVETKSLKMIEIYFIQTIK